jgi:hypothetical protein
MLFGTQGIKLAENSERLVGVLGHPS